MTFSSLRGRLSDAGCTLLVASALVAAIGLANAEPVATDAAIERPDPAGATQNKAIVREAFDGWRDGGNIFTELLAPDVVWTIHGSGPTAGTYHGLEDLVDRALAPLVTRLTGPVVPEVHDIFADGDTVIVRFDGSATTTSGAPYRNQFVWIFRMSEGSVVEAEGFLDLVAYQEVVENNAPRAQ